MNEDGLSGFTLVSPGIFPPKTTAPIDRTYLLVPAQEYIAKYIGTFKEFPPSQKVGSFSLDQVLEKLTAASTAGR